MANSAKTRVLITGAGGFIGSHLTEALVERGCSVKAFIRYNSRRDIGMLKYLPKEKLKRLELFFGDLRDDYSVESAVKGVDKVFHLGALIAIPYSYEHPKQVVETNVLGTLNILMACLKEKSIETVINTSTSEVYGTATYVPIDENHPLQAQSPYSATKIGADKLAESFIDSYNMPIATIRPFNTYGPRQSLRAVIPTIICQALIKDKVELGSLTPRRDFTFIKDTVGAFIKVSETDSCIGKTVNVGSDCDISIRDIVKKVGQIIGKDIKITQSERRIRPKLSEVEILRANNCLAKKLLKWKPEISFDEGLKATVDWFRKNINEIKEKLDVEEYVI